MERVMEFRWLRTLSTDDLCKKQKVSSTYLQNLTGDYRCYIAISSMCFMKMDSVKRMEP